MASQPIISNQAQYADSRGREIIELFAFSTDDPEPRGPDIGCAPGAQTTTISPRTVAQIRARYGGDSFTITNPATGRSHRVSLKRFARHDPDRTYVQFRFHFYPAPFASKEAQLIRESTIREIRRAYEGAIDCHTGKIARQEAEAGVPVEARLSATDIDGLKEHLKRQASAYVHFATHTGILVHSEVAAINNEFATQQPDLFRPW